MGGFLLVTISDTELWKGIQRAIDSAKKLSKPVLLSEVQEIDHIEPLSFFAAGNNQYAGERFFWKDSSESLIFAGLGICKEIQSDQASDRFFHVEEEWKKFVKSAIRIGYRDVQGTGPLMFGGFSFDPLKKQSDLWLGYSDARLHVPEFLLTKNGDKTYLTVNILCTKYDDASLADKIVAKRKAILSPLAQPQEKAFVNIVDEREVAQEQWKDTVKALVEDLREREDLKKVVMARELQVTANEDIPVEFVLRNLLNEQPDSYTFAFEANGSCFVGASPERLVKKEGKRLYSACLAGSIAKGGTEEEEKRLGEELLSDEKNLIEHQYVVDMIRTAMEQVCTEVEIPEKPVLLKMRDIQHLYTPVIGMVKDKNSLLKIVSLLHPTPALGGFPKEMAVEKIREIEGLDRGFYGAPIGWMDELGDGEFAVAIRSGLLKGKNAHLFAGCGIVKDSDADSEFAETKIKFRPMLSALGGMKK